MGSLTPLLHTLELPDQPMVCLGRAGASCSHRRPRRRPTRPPLSPQDVDFHPTELLVASGVIDGHLEVHSFSREAHERRHKLRVRRRGRGGGGGGGA